MASSNSRYDFTGEEVSQLASCTDHQAGLLYKSKCILHTKSTDSSAAYAPKTLGNSTDRGASVLPSFYDTQPYTIRFEVGYMPFLILQNREALLP